MAWALRRGFGIDDLDLDGTRRRKRREMKKPEIWDVWPEEVKDEGKWNCVKVSCVMHVRVIYVSEGCSCMKEWGPIAGPNNVGNSKGTSHCNRRLLHDLLVCEGRSWAMIAGPDSRHEL